MPSKTKRKTNRKTNRKTRSAKKRNNNRKRKTRRVYRKRVKFSQCRGKRASSCRQKPSCKMAMGKKRSHYCRRNKNKKVSVLPKSK